jgi:hypothetical protein
VNVFGGLACRVDDRIETAVTRPEESRTWVTGKSEDIGDRLIPPAVLPAERILDEEGALVKTA